MRGLCFFDGCDRGAERVLTGEKKVSFGMRHILSGVCVFVSAHLCYDVVTVTGGRT